MNPKPKVGGGLWGGGLEGFWGGQGGGGFFKNRGGNQGGPNGVLGKSKRHFPYSSFFSFCGIWPVIRGLGFTKKKKLFGGPTPFFLWAIGGWKLFRFKSFKNSKNQGKARFFLITLEFTFG